MSFRKTNAFWETRSAEMTRRNELGLSCVRGLRSLVEYQTRIKKEAELAAVEAASTPGLCADCSIPIRDGSRRCVPCNARHIARIR